MIACNTVSIIIAGSKGLLLLFTIKRTVLMNQCDDAH